MEKSKLAWKKVEGYLKKELKKTKHIMTFGTLLWKSVILTSVALLLRDIAGIGSAPQYRAQIRSDHRATRLSEQGADRLKQPVGIDTSEGAFMLKSSIH